MCTIPVSISAPWMKQLLYGSLQIQEPRAQRAARCTVTEAAVNNAAVATFLVVLSPLSSPKGQGSARTCPVREIPGRASGHRAAAPSQAAIHPSQLILTANCPLTF